MKGNSLSLADIYCGAGGLSAGFSKAQNILTDGSTAKFDLVFAVDRDDDAMQSFRHFHFGPITRSEADIIAPCRDISTVTPDLVMRAAASRGHNSVDVLVGGPSCQGVSAAGLRNPDDRRNLMLLRFVELVKELKPQWFVMENVPGLTHSNNRSLLEAIFEKLESIGGYRVSGTMLLAANYGVPQFRYRLFVIGAKVGLPVLFPMPTHGTMLGYEGRTTVGDNAPYSTVRDAIWELSTIEPRAYEEDEVPCETTIYNHYFSNLGDVNTWRIRHVPQSGDWRNIPIRYLPERYFATRASDQKGAYGRLLWDSPAFTITGSVGNVTAGPFTHPDQDRCLSVREAACLQSFDPDHRFYGSVGSQYRQIGNAVPPLLAAAVARMVLKCHFEPEVAPEFGEPGRLTLQILREVQAGQREFPTMTPRQIAIERDPYPRLPVPKSRVKATAKQSDCVAWRITPRPQDPFPQDTEWLIRVASQPDNYRAAKRAKAIIRFIEGVTEDQIIAELNVAEASISKWINNYYSKGLHGWRAYHTSLEQIADYDENLADKFRRAVERVRMYCLDPSESEAEDGSAHTRYHMNTYVVELIARYGHVAVVQLIREVEKALGHGVGTVYVDDLMAVADVAGVRIPILQE